MFVKAIIPAVILFLISISATVLSLEEPKYAAVQQLGEVEIRQYESTIQARTPMNDDVSDTQGFRALANYIFGGNDREQEIAMTAPVEIQLAEDGYMAFTLPSEFDMATLPEPDLANVTLLEVPGRRVAAIPFSGWATDGKVSEMTEKLMAVLAENEIKTVGPPSVNQYDPPMTLPWNRRNEIIIEVLP